LITAILQASGQSAQISAKPWARCTSGIDLAVAGVGGIYKNAKRVQAYDFSDPIFVKKNGDFSGREKLC
jgi:hypothetical protein